MGAPFHSDLHIYSHTTGTGEKAVLFSPLLSGTEPLEAGH